MRSLTSFVLGILCCVQTVLAEDCNKKLIASTPRKIELSEIQFLYGLIASHDGVIASEHILALSPSNLKKLWFKTATSKGAYSELPTQLTITDLANESVISLNGVSLNLVDHRLEARASWILEKDQESEQDRHTREMLNLGPFVRHEDMDPTTISLGIWLLPGPRLVIEFVEGGQLKELAYFQ